MKKTDKMEVAFREMVAAHEAFVAVAKEGILAEIKPALRNFSLAQKAYKDAIAAEKETVSTDELYDELKGEAALLDAEEAARKNRLMEAGFGGNYDNRLRLSDVL